MLEDLGVKKIYVQGDSELIIKQIKGECSAKNPRLREYRNASLDLLKIFEKYELTYIPRAQNSLANELAFATSNFQIPHASEQYTVKFKKLPTVPEKINHWQVFEGDEQIDDFFQSRNEFTSTKSSLKHEKDVFVEEQAHETEFSSFSDINMLTHPYEAEMF